MNLYTKLGLSFSAFIILTTGGLACSQTSPSEIAGESSEEASTATLTPASADPDLAYLLISGWHKDSVVYEEYVKEVGPLIKSHGMSAQALGIPGVNMTVLEGSWTPRALSLLEFPSEKAVKGFWNSDAYQNDVKPIRHGYSALDVLQLDGIAGQKTMIDEQSALLIFLVNMEDLDTFLKDYAPHAPKVVERYGGKFLVRTSRKDTEVLEGEVHSESLVILGFPTTKALKGFWGDADYQALSKIRKATGKWSVIEILPISR